MPPPPPPPDVLRAFGADGAPTPLVGGEGRSWRAGGIVLKPVDDAAEAEWTQALLSRVQPGGFRLAEPVAAGGGWVHGGWTAARFVPGLCPAAPDWHAIIDAGLRFGEAAEAARGGGGGGGEIVGGRTHRWARADRAAWGEAEADLQPEAAEVAAAIERLLGEPSSERHFVHGDLSGNTFLDPAGTPVILDVSPYLRPRRWAAAIVVADAVLWHGADAGLARAFADRDLLGRALLFRLLAEEAADAARLEPYRMVLSELDRS